MRHAWMRACDTRGCEACAHAPKRVRTPKLEGQPAACKNKAGTALPRSRAAEQRKSVPVAAKACTSRCDSSRAASGTV
eukprot:3701767-Pleurochrysis_carterae.AAC.1